MSVGNRDECLGSLALALETKRSDNQWTPDPCWWNVEGLGKGGLSPGQCSLMTSARRRPDFCRACSLHFCP